MPNEWILNQANMRWGRRKQIKAEIKALEDLTRG
jgi:hypothetical protein